ncbi:unnamed protein product, partial [marine sediment metagenome]
IGILQISSLPFLLMIALIPNLTLVVIFAVPLEVLRAVEGLGKKFLGSKKSLKTLNPNFSSSLETPTTAIIFSLLFNLYILQIGYDVDFIGYL